jgi:hypothetical protein
VNVGQPGCLGRAISKEGWGSVIEFETAVVSNFLGRGDPCTRGWERERNVADDVSLSGFSREDSYLGAGVTPALGGAEPMDGFRCD